MGKYYYVVIRNNCSKIIKVYFRFRRPKKRSAKLTASITLKPNESSDPLPEHIVVGARGWNNLKKLSCIRIKKVPFQPRFVSIFNKTQEVLSLNIRPPVEKIKIKISTLLIKPNEQSRKVDVRSLSQKKLLNDLIKKNKVSLFPVEDIGPPKGKTNAKGSYGAEDVYICQKCGGPIVFRYHPPIPIHI